MFTKGRIAIPAIAVAALTIAAFPTGASAQVCTATGTVPLQHRDQAAIAATICLINNVRAEHGLRRLTVEPHLASAAAAWSERLVTAGFYSHVDPYTGSNVESRVRNSGYLAGSSIYALGENLVWGAGYRGSPSEAVRMWMQSTGHRENLLDPEWRHIGVGFAAGTPVGAAGGTWAAKFGMKIITRRLCSRSRHRTYGHLRRICRTVSRTA